MKSIQTSLARLLARSPELQAFSLLASELRTSLSGPQLRVQALACVLRAARI